MAPFIVISPGRSGSSYVAGQIVKAGVWGGNMRKGDQWNRQGYFENTEIHKAMRRRFGADWVKGSFPEATKGWANEVLRTIRNQGYEEGPWMIKSGAFYWRTFEPFDPVYVKVWRDKTKILDSFRRCGFLNRFSAQEIETIVDRQHQEMTSIPGLDIHIT